MEILHERFLDEATRATLLQRRSRLAAIERHKDSGINNDELRSAGEKSEGKQCVYLARGIGR